jgi:hypothetical protein
MAKTSTRGFGPERATDDPARRARLRASLAGFEERLRGCKRETQNFLNEHWSEARDRSELAFLLGQIQGVIDHCHELEARYRGERVCLVARDAKMAWEPRSAAAVGPGD